MTTNEYILYIDDDPIELIKFEMALKSTSKSVLLRTFTNGLKGWDYLLANTHQLPNIIVIDLKMPVMNGLEFLEKIKANVSFRKIPVIILSSSDHENDILCAFDHQAAGYFVKPFHTKAYNEVITQIKDYWYYSKTA